MRATQSGTASTNIPRSSHLPSRAATLSQVRLSSSHFIKRLWSHEYLKLLYYYGCLLVGKQTQKRLYFLPWSYTFVFAASCAGVNFLHLFRFAPMAREQVGIRGSSVHMGIFLKVCRLLRRLSCSLKEGIRGDSAGTCYTGRIILNAS